MKPQKMLNFFLVVFVFYFAFIEGVEAAPYVVKKGDCLWTIAQKHHVTVKDLQAINNLQGKTLIYPGQLLQLLGNTKDAKIFKVKNVTNTPSRKEVAGVIASAKRYLGVTYKYGGIKPETGFDCSGFIQYVYKLHGINLPRTAAAQAKSGKRVLKKDLLAGDLVFFVTKSGGQVDHIGLYVGNGSFIHASSNLGITLTSLQNAWYVPRYAGACRII